MKLKFSFVVMSLFTGIALLGAAGCSAGGDEESDPSAEAEGAVVGRTCRSSRECGQNEFCDLPCSTQHPGVCVTVPDRCLQINDPVCSCQNRTITNDCVRRQNKIGLSHKGVCIR
jgi:hypothetical protein